MKPRRNLITDVEGLSVGQAHDEAAASGVTVILADRPVIAAVDVRGGAPASRETETLRPENLVQEIDAIVFAGGSVYGLAAGDGVAAWLGARGRGFALGGGAGVPPSPIVPVACLYDLSNGGAKDWGEDPPYRTLGRIAAGTATPDFDLGTAGAGFGARAGALPGGIGSASAIMANGGVVGALAAVNSFGSVIAPGSGQFWAAPFEIDDEFGGLGVSQAPVFHQTWGQAKASAAGGLNTTLACIATDVALSRVELLRVAVMAQDGLARAIRPAHTPFDGDIVFALSTGLRELPSDGRRPLEIARIGATAADVLARAIARGVFHAKGLGRHQHVETLG